MEFKAALTKLEALSGRLHYMLLISIGLLLSNIVLAFLTGWAFMHQKRTIVPVAINAPFTVSDYKVDTSYLRQMALFFVAERLNLTPDNVDQAQKIVLQYTAPEFYHEFSDILLQEKKAVIKEHISSAFYPTEIIPDADGLKVIIKGTLNRWVGNLALPPLKKNYLVKFTYSYGALKILSFSEIGEKDNAEN